MRGRNQQKYRKYFEKFAVRVNHFSIDANRWSEIKFPSSFFTAASIKENWLCSSYAVTAHPLTPSNPDTEQIQYKKVYIF